MAVLLLLIEKSTVICSSSYNWTANERSPEEPAGVYANKMKEKSVPFTPLYHIRLHNYVYVESEESFLSLHITASFLFAKNGKTVDDAFRLIAH